MPDITLAPVLIDNGTTESAQCSFQNPFFYGPFKVGSNLYAVLQARNFPPNTITVFKSTDTGASWTQMDTVNSPTWSGLGFQIRLSARLNPDGTTITIAFTPNTNSAPTTLSFVTFSTLTDTFTAGVIPNVTSNDAVGGIGLRGFDFIVRTNGNILLAFNQIVGPNVTQGSMGYVLYNGVTWSAFTVVAAGNDGTQLNWEVPALVLDTATGITHFFLRQSLVTGKNEFYLQINGANVSTAAAQIAANRPANDRPNFGRPVLWQGQVALPVFTVAGGGGTLVNVRVHLGTPLNAPVWSFTDFDSASLTQLFDVEAAQLMVDTSNNLWVVWIHFPDNTVMQLRRSINTGSGWGAVDIFYDMIANPPNALPAASQFFYMVTCGAIGSVGAVITVQDAANLVRISYFLRQAAAPTTATLTLVKTVSPGGQAVATDFTLSATGPATISGAGGVGPSIVPPGVYSLAETPVAGYLSQGWSLAGGGTLVGDVLTLAAGDTAVVTITNAPMQKPSPGGGSYFPRFLNKTLLALQASHSAVPAPLYWLYDFPNPFDICLAREWRLYNEIDPTLLACIRKPDCFSGEMGVRPWVDPPGGAVTFNPDKAIPLPNPAAVDVVVLSFRVPIAYDGIVLAQYHGYVGQGVFLEGSGDIVWRVRVNGRYLRDMGNMLVSIGSPQTLSPCPGGLWIYSGDLVEYVVSAPNTSGSLPLPGQGNILAGLHGWFYPRI